MSDERTFPQSLDAERAWLGGIMLMATADNMGPVLDRLEGFDGEDFYVAGHQRLHELMLHMARKGQPPEMLGLVDEIMARGIVEAVGGLAYVSQLPELVPSSENLNYYADLVREKAARRRVLAFAASLTEAAHRGDEDISTSLDAAEAGFMALRGWEKQGGTMLNASQLFAKTYNWGRDNWERQNRIRSHWWELNRDLVTLRPTSLVILAARPAMGKTAFALQLVDAAARPEINPDMHGAGVFSLEMMSEALGGRMVAQNSKVPGLAIMSGLKEQHLRDRFDQVTAELGNTLIMAIDDDPNLSMGTFRTKCRKMKAMLKGQMALVVVDYLQLFSLPSGSENTSTKVGMVSRMLKLVAKEMNVCVLCLSQLNRKCETRGDRRPMISDLRDSGAIEQDADAILFLYRDEYYNARPEEPGVCEDIIAKQRGGPTGTIKLHWNGPATRFSDLVAPPRDQ